MIRSMAEGYVFTSICLSTGGGGGMTAWSEGSGGCLPGQKWMVWSEGSGLAKGGGLVRGCLVRAFTPPPPHSRYAKIRSTVGWYASYRNAFLLYLYVQCGTMLLSHFYT